jgi:hypothetical protein
MVQPPESSLLHKNQPPDATGAAGLAAALVGLGGVGRAARLGNEFQFSICSFVPA